MPVMRKLGKEISKGNGRSFLEQTTDNSYEEKNNTWYCNRFAQNRKL